MAELPDIEESFPRFWFRVERIARERRGHIAAQPSRARRSRLAEQRTGGRRRRPWPRERCGKLRGHRQCALLYEAQVRRCAIPSKFAAHDLANFISTAGRITGVGQARSGAINFLGSDQA